MSVNTGGPAFPAMDDTNFYPGMTLRDYFAAKAMVYRAQAMTSYMANPDAWAEEVAKNAYKLADAMLKAREE